MVTSRRSLPHRSLPVAAAAALLLAVASAAAQAPTGASVTLPLADYLQLVDQARRAGEAQAAAAAAVEPLVSAVVGQRTAVVVDPDRAHVTAVYEVEQRGAAPPPVRLPVTGLGWTARVAPEGAASLLRVEGEAAVTAKAGGRFTVTVSSVAALAASGGVSRLALAPVAAPVAATTVELPADLAWACPGAVVASDTVEGTTRRLELALGRGRAHSLELRREVAGAEAERVLARTVVVTVVRLDADGAVRHDIVLYEVQRGRLGRMEVALPAGLEVERLASDEGDLPPLAEGGRVAVERAARLAGTGWLVVSSRPTAAGALPLEPVEPAVEVRARYLAFATSVAATAEPAPAGAWARVDLADLPAELAAAAGALDLVAAWRRTDTTAPTSLEVTALPPAEPLPTLVSRRDTTTLVTVEGTLLHRDRLTLARGGTALGLELPAGATLWSAAVNGLPVRPLARDDRTVVPLPLGTQAGAVVEVVVVEQGAIPPGRSRLGLSPPAVPAPVLTHEWRLLLPEGNRYRFAGGDLEPAPPRAVAGGGVGGEDQFMVDGLGATFAEELVVAADEPEVDVSQVATGQTFRPDDARRRQTAAGERQSVVPQAANAKDELASLSQGLVGGVRPVPVAIPEAGKVLLLAGALPPERVEVELEVRAARD